MYKTNNTTNNKSNVCTTSTSIVKCGLISTVLACASISSAVAVPIVVPAQQSGVGYLEEATIVPAQQSGVGYLGYRTVQDVAATTTATATTTAAPDNKDLEYYLDEFIDKLNTTFPEFFAKLSEFETAHNMTGYEFGHDISDFVSELNVSRKDIVLEHADEDVDKLQEKLGDLLQCLSVYQYGLSLE